ncbi:MAG: metallophosphoesterase, partial [Armatimonadota bacterium]|nr:metallophosphoesterase [Armatimonadota bacterium]
ASALRIVVPGLERSTRVLHLTDTHICRPDVGSPHEAACQKERSRRPAEEQEAHFANLLQRAAEADIDLLLLTGDIVHFPAQTSIQFVRALLNSTGKPWLYVPGNHDWYYPGQRPDTALRLVQSPLLAPLFGSQGPSLCYRHEQNGLQFLGVDNSTYQIEVEQLTFARECLQNELPTVVLIHIPITQPHLRAPTIAKWRDPILMGDTIEDSRRALWAWEPDRAETTQFIELLRAATNLVAIFCGHVHFAHDERFSDSAIQLVGAPGFEGGFRVVEFQPG